MRLLLVQADSPHRGITAQWLSMLNGVSAVQIAGSGAEAMALIDSMLPDVILVDASAIPDMDGFEFTRKAKSNGGSYRVVMTIALCSPRFEAAAMRAGADHAVEKSALHTVLPILLAEYRNSGSSSTIRKPS